jgi:hypothetical protein
MIDTLLGKVSALFEKDYLFASLLPVLIFVPAVVVTFAYAIGFERIWAWIDAWTPLEKTVIAAVVSFVVVILAYVVHGMRPAFAHFWSGDSPLLLAGLGPIAELQRQREYRRRRDATAPTTEWAKLRGTRGTRSRSQVKEPPLSDAETWTCTAVEAEARDQETEQGPEGRASHRRSAG